MEIHAILHPITGPFARDDVPDVGHREDAIGYCATFRLGVVLDSIGSEHDVEIERTIRELNKAFSGDNRLFLFLDGIRVDSTYTSGSQLSASATLSGDFQSRGITLGTATTQFTLGGSANTLTVRAVPEPTAFVSAGLAIGLLGLAAWRRR